MSEITKSTMVREYWKHADAGLADEFARMHGCMRGSGFIAGIKLYGR